MDGKGAVTALLDIYAKAIRELKQTVAPIPDALLAEVVDATTADANCRSVQAILAHVVHAGYGYATTIRNRDGSGMQRREKILLASIADYGRDLDEMFAFTKDVFENICDDDLEVFEDGAKMLTGWGQRYDVEQLMEHAIVHVQRHDRQIKRLLSL